MKQLRSLSLSALVASLVLAGCGGGGASPACGSLNVGNVNTGGRRVGQPVREVVVVIKGDVIKANNKCR